MPHRAARAAAAKAWAAAAGKEEGRAVGADELEEPRQEAIQVAAAGPQVVLSSESRTLLRRTCSCCPARLRQRLCSYSELAACPCIGDTSCHCTRLCRRSSIGCAARCTQQRVGGRVGGWVCVVGSAGAMRHGVGAASHRLFSVVPSAAIRGCTCIAAQNACAAVVRGRCIAHRHLQVSSRTGKR